jgi:hypothetical protein
LDGCQLLTPTGDGARPPHARQRLGGQLASAQHIPQQLDGGVVLPRSKRPQQQLGSARQLAAGRRPTRHRLEVSRQACHLFGRYV